nr:MAG TPA: hypothetical protein [Caudoviricetes sp.]
MLFQKLLPYLQCCNSWLSCFFNPDRTNGYLSKYEFGLFLCP